MVLVIPGCVTSPEPPPVATEPAGFPDQDYRDAGARGESVYRIDHDTSVVQILVYRTGVLARLGHDHAMTARNVQGYAWLPAEGGARADLYLTVAELVVDDPEARAAAGFTTEPSASDRDGTYHNMLLSLDADHYPLVHLHVTVATIDLSGDRNATVDLTLHGTTRRLIVPAHIVTNSDGFRVTGMFQIRQTDFGITPFSVFGGALAVRDELVLHFDLGFSTF